MEIQEYLEEKGCIVTERGDSNISTHCMFCEEETDKAGRLYINVDEYDDSKYGLFFCFLCQEKGHYNRIREHFGDSPIKSDLKLKDDPIYEIATRYYEERLLDNMEAYKFLIEDRGLFDETIKKARLGWADGGLTNHLIKEGFDIDHIKSSGLAKDYGDYFNNEIIIPYLDYGIAVQLRGKKMGGKYRSMQGAKGMLYGTDAIIGEATVSVTEGELCALHLQQLGFPAVGVPGANTWKDEWNDLFQAAKRVYVVYDNDKAGKVGGEKAAQHIGPRARIVELPIKNIDIEDYIFKYGKNYDDIDFLFRKARGGTLVSVHDARERWLEIEGNPDVEGLRLNVPAIDSQMTFGLLPGQIMTMIAKTNAGKSLMSINYFHRMRMLYPEITILYLSLEQTRNEWFERAWRIYQFYYPGNTMKEFMDFWGDSFFLVDKNRISEHELRDSIEQFNYETGEIPNLTCIDYLGYFARGVTGGSEYDRVTNAIMTSKEVAKDYQTSMIIPHQSNRTGDFGEELKADMAKSSGGIEETSDVMLSLWNNLQKDNLEDESERGYVYQRMLKSRNGGVNSLARYVFCPLTLAIVPTDDPLIDRAWRERQYAAAGDTWQQAVKRHETGDLSI